MWMLGAAMTLPMILAAGPLAGYFLGRLIMRYYAKPDVIPLFMVLGLIGSGIQAFQLIKRIHATIRSTER